MEEIPMILDQIGPLLNRRSHGDPEFRDELLQETALQLLRRERRGHDPSTPIAIGIANNICCDMIRERERRRERWITFSDLGAQAAGFPEIHSSQLIWEATSDLRSVEKRWRRSLRPQERRVLKGLRRGMTQVEVAAREGIPAGTVASWVHRAHRRLEAMLKALNSD